MTELLHDKGLSTKIGSDETDAYGQLLSTEKRRKMHRLRTWDDRFRNRDSNDRNLRQALGEIERMAAGLGLPQSTQETASVMYRRALEEKLLPGRSIEGVASAALYAAARLDGTPRPVDEFATVSRVERLRITRAYRYLIRELEIEIEPADPVDYVPRIISDVELSDEVALRARELLEAGKREGVHSGKSPVALAAAAVYAAGKLCNEDVTQNDLSDTTPVSNVTIRNRYPELLDVAEI